MWITFFVDESLAGCEKPPFDAMSARYNVTRQFATEFGSSFIVSCKWGYTLTPRRFGRSGNDCQQVTVFL